MAVVLYTQSAEIYLLESYRGRQYKFDIAAKLIRSDRLFVVLEYFAANNLYYNSHIRFSHFAWINAFNHNGVNEMSR